MNPIFIAAILGLNILALAFFFKYATTRPRLFLGWVAFLIAVESLTVLYYLNNL